MAARKFSRWLYRISVNEALQLLRRRNRGEVLVAELPAGSLVGADEGEVTIARIDGEREQRLVNDRLAELPSGLGLPVMLRDIEGLTNEQVARALDLSPPATKARIHRGRLRLRELLAEDFPDRAVVDVRPGTSASSDTAHD